MYQVIDLPIQWTEYTLHLHQYIHTPDALSVVCGWLLPCTDNFGRAQAGAGGGRSCFHGENVAHARVLHVACAGEGSSIACNWVRERSDQRFDPWGRVVLLDNCKGTWCLAIGLEEAVWPVAPSYYPRSSFSYLRVKGHFDCAMPK